jgi:trigger factor
MSVNVQIEQLPACQTKITLQFDAADVDAAYDRVYAQLAKHGRIPGFRPGKAPRAIIRRHVGGKALRDSAFNELIREPLEKALDDIDLLVPPEIPGPDEVQLEEGQPLELVLTAVSGPRVKLADLTGTTILEPDPEVSEESIEKVLAELRETHAEERATDRQEVQKGDAVDLTLKVAVEGEEKPIEDVEQTIVVGQGEHFPDIDDQLIGKTIGSVLELDVTYPEDYHDPSLAGKAAKFEITIKALRERVLPELDDEFAKKIDPERFATLDDLRAEIRRQIGEEYAQYSRQEVVKQILETLLLKSEIELPDVLLDRMYQSNMESLAEELEAEGITVAELCDSLNISEEQQQEFQRRRARRTAELRAVMAELARQVEPPTDEEIAAEAENFAREHNLDAALVQQALPLQQDLRARIEDRVLQRRIFDAIIAKVHLQRIPPEEYRKRREEMREEKASPSASADEEATTEQAPAADSAQSTDAPEGPKTPESAEATNSADATEATAATEPADVAAEEDS